MDETMMSFRREGDPAFTEKTETETPTAPSAEETTTTQTPSVEGEQTQTEKEDDSELDNFAKHPRWQERETDWKTRFNDQEKRHTEEIEKLRTDLESKFGSKRDLTAPTIIPSWFGGDEEQWFEYQKSINSLVGQAKEEALKEIAQKQEKEQQAIEQATNYMNTQVAEIEASKELNPEGVKVDKNKLLKFVLDNDLVDSKGNWNYKAGFRLMQANKTAPKTEAINEKKKIANATTSENKAETKTTPYKTSADFQKPGGRPW